MSPTSQFVLLGVARARETWASDLARWSTSGAAPIEFVKCLTADEARMVLGSGRRVSALLIDARGPGVDRELIGSAADAAVPTIVVSDRSVHRDWEALGCAAVIEHDPDPQVVVERLGRHCRPVDRSRRAARSRLPVGEQVPRGRLVAVTGCGGTGTSTVSMALAQALARPGPQEPAQRVVLVDGGRRSDLAMYHDVGDVVPGLPELVEAHRSDRLEPDEVRRLTFDVGPRGYRLLLGRRRPDDWVGLRRSSVDAALDALRRANDLVVVDAEPDLDDQAMTGSPDVEDRHAITLAALDAAELVLVTGRGDLHGVHALIGLLDAVRQRGVPSDRVLPVVVGAPRSPVGRARLATALERLGSDDDHLLHPAPLMLRRHRDLDDHHDRVAILPTALARPLGRSVRRRLGELGTERGHTTPQQVRPGELGLARARLAERRDEVA